MNARDVSRLFWAAKALLVAVLLYFAVAVIVTPLYLGRALKPRPVSGDERVADVPVPEPVSRPPADLSTILENDLFGGSKSAGQSAPTRARRTDTMMSAEEELGLRLVGAVAIAGRSAASRAVIQNTATGVALPYCIGDSVASATIESIQADCVVLRHEGKRKALWLREAAALAPGSPQVNPTPSEAKAERPVAQQAARSSLPSMSYVENVFHKAKIEPYVRNGRTQGLKITGLEDDSVTSLLGLRNGDVVQMVNGQSLASKQKAFQVLQKAKTQPRLQIQLLRDGKTKELFFDLQQ